jgi:hypothetical protein
LLQLKESTIAGGGVYINGNTQKGGVGMKEIFAKVSAVLISLIVMGGAAVVIAGDEKQQFEKPSFSPGEYWVYSTPKGEMRREYVGEEEGYHVFMIKGQKELLDGDLNIKGDNRITFKFPLHVGKHWRYEYERRQPNRTFPVMVTCEVKGIERVETTAGTFQALNITCAEDAKLQKTTLSNYSYWYAPEVKNVIKNTKEMVLKKYNIKK